MGREIFKGGRGGAYNYDHVYGKELSRFNRNDEYCEYFTLHLSVRPSNSIDEQPP